MKTLLIYLIFYVNMGYYNQHQQPTSVLRNITECIALRNIDAVCVDYFFAKTQGDGSAVFQ